MEAYNGTVATIRIKLSTIIIITIIKLKVVIMIHGGWH